jgi:hypothetical protein
VLPNNRTHGSSGITEYDTCKNVSPGLQAGTSTALSYRQPKPPLRSGLGGWPSSLAGPRQALFLRSGPLHHLNTLQHGQEGQGNRKLWCVCSSPWDCSAADALVVPQAASLTTDLHVLQESVATRRTHCAVVAVAAHTTSRRAHALAAATLLPGRGHVSIWKPVGPFEAAYGDLGVGSGGVGSAAAAAVPAPAAAPQERLSAQQPRNIKAAGAHNPTLATSAGHPTAQHQQPSTGFSRSAACTLPADEGSWCRRMVNMHC